MVLILGLLLSRKSQTLANRDAMTGLPIRHVFLDMVRRALEQSQRQSRAVAVLLLDIDRFREANESLGYSAGDTLLTLIAKKREQSSAKVLTKEPLGLCLERCFQTKTPNDQRPL